MEQWKQIRNHSEYFVSNYGRIKSLRKSKKRRKSDEYILKPTWFTPRPTNEPFLVCSIYSDKNSKNNIFIHKIVAENFVKIDDFSKTIVKHIDGDRSNNHASNLMWMTSKESRKYEKDRQLRL